MGMAYYPDYESVPDFLRRKIRKSHFPPTEEEKSWMHLGTNMTFSHFLNCDISFSACCGDTIVRIFLSTSSSHPYSLLIIHIFTVSPERCMRCVPHDEDTGGFFVATLRKVAKPVSRSDSSTHDIRIR